MRWLRQEFHGLRPTPLAKDLGILAAAVSLGAGLYCYLIALLWIAS